MTKTVIVLDRVKAVRAGHLYSVQVNEELQNGNIGVLGDLLDGEREIYAINKPAADTLGESLVLVAHSEINYDESSRANANLNKFSVPANKPARAYELVKHDIISTDAVDLIGEAPVEGNLVVAQEDSYRLKEVAKATEVGTYGFVGKIIGARALGTTTAVGMPGAIGSVTELVEIEVVKN